ncbi:MAG: helix-turn-helix domain-containing protein [Eubacteriaceae bacterium]|nr:helix-turn-helix domain-containing protein [Eubacteriaceae bacterium]
MSSISDHVGKRIRLYRKNQNMSIDEFSAMIGKSKSTISKYENGEISIDVETLFEIAAALDVSAYQLLDYRDEDARISDNHVRGFFSDVKHMFMYYMSGAPIRLVKCVLEFNQINDNEHKVILYNTVRDMDDFYDCRQLYFGDVYYSDSYVNMFMTNQVNNSEEILLTVPNPMAKIDETFGLISGISERYRMPISTRVLLSHSNRYSEDELADKLILNKDDMKEIRKYNVFMLPSSWR